MVIPLAVGWVFCLIQLSLRGSGTGNRERRSSRAPQIAFYVFLVSLMLLAIFFSRSRTGIFSALASLVFMGILGQLKTERGTWLRGMAIVLGCSLVYALWTGVAPVLSRFDLFQQSSYIESEGRIPLWRSEIRLLWDYPILGTGLGTFWVALRRYQDVAVDKFVDHAHNDYLQFACDTGLMGFPLLFIPIFCAWGK